MELEKGLKRLPFKPEGYNYWTWRDHKIHYVEQGEGFPVVLIHCLGASLFHWRYNIPELAKNYKVYAIDLLGCGWSEKALIEYDALVWRDQVVDFLKEIVKEPAILIGHGTGGFTALMSAAGLPEQQVVGVALLNSALGNANSDSVSPKESLLQKFILKPLNEICERQIFALMFWRLKKPIYVEAILKYLYNPNDSNVDDYLVESFTKPAAGPNAREVYYRLLTKGNMKNDTLESVLGKLSCPLLLIWGRSPANATKIKEFYPNASLVTLKAGSCPHDEVPELVNIALADWLATLTSKSSPQTA